MDSHGLRARWYRCLALFASIALSLAMVSSAHATFPGSNGRIAFASDRDGDFEIFTMNQNGTGVVQLTNNTASDRQPSFPWGGKQLAFASDRDGDLEIFVMSLDGTGQTQLTFNSAADEGPQWSPDGAKIAFSSNRDGDWEVYVMNADGTGQTQLTFNAIEDLVTDWSPDGARIAFTRGASRAETEIWVMNANGAGQTQLTFNTVQDVFGRWSPDGSRMLFRRELAHGAGWAELFRMDKDGSGETNLTLTAVVYEGEGAYSPDGTKIPLSSSDGTNSEIYLMNADGSGRTLIKSSPGTDSDLDWQQVAEVPAASRAGLWALVALLGGVGVIMLSRFDPARGRAFTW